MAPHKHSLIPLTLGACLAAGFLAYRGGLALSSAEAFFAALVCSPIAVASLAAYVGRSKKAGRGAVAIAWLFLLAEVALLWNIGTGQMASTAGIGIVIAIAGQLVLAVGLLTIALFQKKSHAANVT
jgi:drug/metabolite transporter (DMT)-like permease